MQDFNKLPGFEVVNNIYLNYFTNYSISVSKNISINPCIISIIARLWIKTYYIAIKCNKKLSLSYFYD